MKPPFIHDHVYSSPYAGLDEARQICTFAHPDAPPCGQPRAKHANFITPRSAQPFDVVQKPKHYNSHPSGVEWIEVGRYLSGNWFNAGKYIFRADLKNGQQDIDKAHWYARDAITHNIPVHSAQWKQCAQWKLDLIIDTETNPLRTEFFISIKQDQPSNALRCIERMLEDEPCDEG